MPTTIEGKFIQQNESIKKWYPLLLICILLASCAPTRIVKPLKKGEQQLTASFGGPLIHFAGAVIPVPYTTVCYANGLSNKLTAFASLHTTSAAFGNLQSDLGITYSVWQNDSSTLGFSVSPIVNLAVHSFTHDFRLWPQLDLNVYKVYGKKKNFVYAGVGNWFELNGIKAHNEIQKQRYFFNPHIGHTFVKNKWNFSLELKFLAPTTSNTYIVVDYAKLYGKTGATGIYFGATRKF